MATDGICLSSFFFSLLLLLLLLRLRLRLRLLLLLLLVLPLRPGLVAAWPPPGPTGT